MYPPPPPPIVFCLHASNYGNKIWLQTPICDNQYLPIISLLGRIKLALCCAHALVSVPGLRFLFMVFVLSFNQTFVCLFPTKWPNMEENLISRCSSNVQTVVVLFLWSNCCKAAGRCSYLASWGSQECSGYATRLFTGFPLSANHWQYRERQTEMKTGSR